MLQEGARDSSCKAPRTKKGSSGGGPCSGDGSNRWRANPDVPIHLRFGVVELDAARSCLQAIERKALSSCTSSVCGRPEDFDLEVAGLERSFEALGRRKLLSVSLHYHVKVEEITFAALLTVSRKPSGALRAHAFTHSGFFLPGSASPREKFWAFMTHALELESLLGASRIKLASSSGGEDEWFTGWRVGI